MTFVAIAVSSTFQTEAEGTLAAGESLQIDGYELTYEGTRIEQRPPFAAQLATVEVRYNGRGRGILEPSLNHYPSQMQPLGTPAVLVRASHDLYLTLMNVAGDGTIGLRAIRTPAVVWIWIGVVIVAAGTLLCLLPARAPLRRIDDQPSRAST